MKKILCLLLAMTMTFGCLTACGSKDTSEPAADGAATGGDTADTGSSETIEGAFKLGAVGPLTGDAAIYGQAVVNGAQIAVDEINASDSTVKFELNKQDNGAFSSVDITYKAEGAYWPNMFFGWDIDLDANRFTLFGTATSDDDEIGELNLGDSVIVMPTVTLRKTAKVINDPQAVNAAVGVWTSDDDQRIELRADMTVTYSNGWMTYDYDEWRTADNEVQLFLAGRDHSMFYTARFVLSGDELIEFPGFDECRHFRRAEE